MQKYLIVKQTNIYGFTNFSKNFHFHTANMAFLILYLFNDCIHHLDYKVSNGRMIMN
jgi:hypothetical protein